MSRRHAQAQRGAAMVETVVIAVFVLVPLYLAVQAIAKLADVRSASQNAARYAVWERTVWQGSAAGGFAAANAPNQKSDAQIRSEILVRLLNERASGFKYQHSDKTATTLAKGIDPLWQDTAAKDLIDDPAKIRLSLSSGTPSKDVLGKTLGLFSAISIPHVTGSMLPPLPSDNLAQAEFSFDEVGAKSEVYKRLWSKKQGLPEDWKGENMVARAAILSNSWAANARDGTHAMVKHTVPTAQGLGTVIETGAKLTMAAWDPLVAPRLDMGRIAPDVVPPDRLK